MITEEDWDKYNQAKNNGGDTEYYKLPKNSDTLNDLIDHVDMRWNLANIFKACYRFGRKDKTQKIYDLNKIIYYANRELKKLNSSPVGDTDI